MPTCDVLLDGNICISCCPSTSENYVKDVTSKYASDWMHSTRKLRVCANWWQATLAPYCDPNTERESMENDEIKGS